MAKRKKSKRSAFSPTHIRSMAKWRVAGLKSNAEQLDKEFGSHLHSEEHEMLTLSIATLTIMLEDWGKG
jgi:hypothetical protein